MELISGGGSFEEQVAAVLALGVKNLVVTLGKDGVCCFTPDGKIEVAAPDLPVVDTVGAGDCFVGVLAASLERGLALEDALRHAVSGASLSVGIPGAQASYTYWKEICEAARNA